MSDSENGQFREENFVEPKETFREFITFFRDLIVILIIVILVRVFIMTPFRINGSSMETSYHDKEYILVDKFSYLNFPQTLGTLSGTTWIDTALRATSTYLPLHIGDPNRGDVVVITPHVDRSREYYIKRVVGLPNDTIRISGGKVFIKKAGGDTFIEIKEPYLSASNQGHTYLPEYIEGDQFLIPENAYWVMGDNRNNSADSRTCFQNCFDKDVSAHFIKRSDIVGKVFLNFGYFNIFGEGGLLDSGKVTWTYAPRLLNHPRNASYPELDLQK